MTSRFRIALGAACFCALCSLVAPVFASDRCRVTFANATPYEIVEIVMTLETRHEPRLDRSVVYLGPGESLGIAVAGAIGPLRIRAEAADALFVFDDLSTLEMRPDMHLEFSRNDDGLWLLQSEPDGVAAKAAGRVVELVTSANAVAAMDKDELVKAGSLPAVHAAVAERVETLHATLGEPVGFDVEAGPIRDNEQARARCTEAARKWSEEHADAVAARWTGYWLATVPDKASVCNLRCGPPLLAEALFEEGNGFHFPVAWNGMIGAGRAAQLYPDSSEVGIFVSLRMSDDAVATIREARADLAADGLRPWQLFVDRRAHGGDVDLDFAEREESAEEAWNMVEEEYRSARFSGALREMNVILVSEAQFRALRSGDGELDFPAAILRCGRQTLQATFIPAKMP